MLNSLIDPSHSADAIGLFCRLQMQSKRDLPIRASEMGVLIFVHRQQGVTPQQIAQFFKMAKPSVTAIVQNLTQLQYLLKEPSSHDKRSYTLSITSKGDHLVKQTHQAYYVNIEALQKGMGQGRFEQLIDLIQQANVILQENKL